MVGNYTLGGGLLVSRLAIEIREKRGLTYGVYSEFVPMPGLGPFLITLSTQNNQATQALKMTEETLASFLKTGPTEQELAAAKQYLTGSFPLSLASNESIANMLLKMEFYHLPANYLDTYIEHVNQVTRDQIIQAFQQLIHPDKMLQVSVGKM
jgi:zinc protease